MSPAAPSLKGAEVRAPGATLAFRNRQRDRRLNLPFLRRVLRHVLAEELRVPCAELCFHFVTAEKMARVNWQFLRHEGSTDVITFDYTETEFGTQNLGQGLHGEAFICVADAVKQAREFKSNWQSEVVRYAVHAVLHLRGYDDLQRLKRRVMKREENRLMRELTSRFDFAELERQTARR